MRKMTGRASPETSSILKESRKTRGSSFGVIFTLEALGIVVLGCRVQQSIPYSGDDSCAVSCKPKSQSRHGILLCRSKLSCYGDTV
jgi:hypothetical protein